MLFPFVKGADTHGKQTGKFRLGKPHGFADGGRVRLPKVFEKVADFPWYAGEPPLFGQCGKTSFDVRILFVGGSAR